MSVLGRHREPRAKRSLERPTALFAQGIPRVSRTACTVRRTLCRWVIRHVNRNWAPPQSGEGTTTCATEASVVLCRPVAGDADIERGAGTCQVSLTSGKTLPVASSSNRPENYLLPWPSS